MGEGEGVVIVKVVEAVMSGTYMVGELMGTLVSSDDSEEVWRLGLLAVECMYTMRGRKGARGRLKLFSL